MIPYFSNVLGNLLLYKRVLELLKKGCNLFLQDMLNSLDRQNRHGKHDRHERCVRCDRRVNVTDVTDVTDETPTPLFLCI